MGLKPVHSESNTAFRKNFGHISYVLLIHDNLVIVAKTASQHKDILFFIININWYSLHARLNSHYEAWSYRKRKHKKVKAYRKSI